MGSGAKDTRQIRVLHVQGGASDWVEDLESLNECILEAVFTFGTGFDFLRCPICHLSYKFVLHCRYFESIYRVASLESGSMMEMETSGKHHNTPVLPYPGVVESEIVAMLSVVIHGPCHRGLTPCPADTVLE